MEKEKTIGLALRELNNAIGRAFARTGEAGGGGRKIPPVQTWFLEYLAEREGEGEAVFQRDLEARFGIRRPTVSGIVDRMERGGLVERRAAPGDGRLRMLLLTERARTLRAEIAARVESFERALEAGVGEDEKRDFLRLVEKLRNNAEGYGSC